MPIANHRLQARWAGSAMTHNLRSRLWWNCCKRLRIVQLRWVTNLSGRKRERFSLYQTQRTWQTLSGQPLKPSTPKPLPMRVFQQLEAAGKEHLSFHPSADILPKRFRISDAQLSQK